MTEIELNEKLAQIEEERLATLPPCSSVGLGKRFVEECTSRKTMTC